MVKMVDCMLSKTMETQLGKISHTRQMMNKPLRLCGDGMRKKIMKE